MTELSALSSSSTATTAVSASGHKPAHHSGGAHFQSLVSAAGGTGTTQPAGQTAAAATSTASATGSVSGALGGLQHVLDLLQGVTA